MSTGAPFATPTPSTTDKRPRDDELDLFGLTHPGRVRAENQDTFLLCTVHPTVVVHATNLPEPEQLSHRGQRLATILLVADGVGGSAAGSRASRIAAEAVTRYVASSLRYFNDAGAPCEQDLIDALHTAAQQAHNAVRAEADERPETNGMATTLSLGVVVWPWMYVVQVGDSRCYFYQDRQLRQVTRDQTLAQDLVDQGILSREHARSSPFGHVLSSAIGAPEAVPEITRVDVRQRGCVILVCTDGLTKHVSDEEIAGALGSMQSAEQVCRDLVDLALQRGGTDNITVVIGRARRSQ